MNTTTEIDDEWVANKWRNFLQNKLLKFLEEKGLVIPDEFIEKTERYFRWHVGITTVHGEEITTGNFLRYLENGKEYAFHKPNFSRSYQKGDLRLLEQANILVEFLNSFKASLIGVGVPDSCEEIQVLEYVALAQKTEIEKCEAHLEAERAVGKMQKTVLLENFGIQADERAADVSVCRVFPPAVRQKNSKTIARLVCAYSDVKSLCLDVRNVQEKVFGLDSRLKLCFILHHLLAFLAKHRKSLKQEMPEYRDVILRIKEEAKKYASKKSVAHYRLQQELVGYETFESLREKSTHFGTSQIRNEYFAKVLSVSQTQGELFFVVKHGDNTPCWPKAVRRLAKLKDLSPFERKR